MMFDRVFVINLDRNPDRWKQFQADKPVDWPLPEPERFTATDGRLIPAPQWWKAGPAAWGCFRSHYRILEESLNRGAESILVLEDDALFVSGFSRRVPEFMNALPGDWDWIYLGGQHIEQEWGLPTRVNKLVYRPYNVHRAHAYALRGRRTIEYVYNHLNTPTAWGWGGHVDHRFGELHKNFPGSVYVPSRWLVGQREGMSNIKHKALPTNFFVDAQKLVAAPLSIRMVAVVGEDDRMRSFVAAALHHLGVPMGESRVDRITLRNLVTALSPGLDGLCKRFFSESTGEALSNHAFRVSKLRNWASKRGRIHQKHGSWLGGSHPILGLIPESLSEAWNQPLVIRVVSPIANAANTSEMAMDVHRKKLRDALARFDTVRFSAVVDFDVSRFANSKDRVNFLCDRLGLSPRTERVQRALRVFDIAASQPSHNAIDATN